MLLMEEQFSVHDQLLSGMIADVRNEVVKPHPVCHPRGNHAPPNRRRCEPGNLPAASGSGMAVRRRNPGSDDGEGICDGEDGGGSDADVWVDGGRFLTPFTGRAKAEEEKAPAKEETNEGVDGVAI